MPALAKAGYQVHQRVINSRQLFDCNPAFERLQNASSLLLLQGPRGPVY